MKAVILAGGLGTRLSEETVMKPKPMVEIGNMPILWHIMKIYSCHGINDFIICLGYKSYMIKEFFINYYLHRSDVTVDIRSRSLTVHHNYTEPWVVTLVDTGEPTATGGRIKRVAKYIDNATFCLTYGDVLSDVNITEEIEFHRAHGKLATLAAVHPPGRFGAVILDGKSNVNRFEEKTEGEDSWINAGFFILEPQVLDYIEGDTTPWEGYPLQRLAQEQQLLAFKHSGFWLPMDSLRDKNRLNDLWKSGTAPWKLWQ
jgi:glucose-1-phosphate cytidylyltransferase